MTKKVLLTIFLTIGISQMWAQKDSPMMNMEHMDSQKFQWGYYFGGNYMDYKIDLRELDYDNPALREIQVKKSIGFNVGFTTSLRLMKYVDLRCEPGLVYNQRYLYFSWFAEKRDYVRSVKSTYVYFPLLIKLSSKRWYNFKPYITAGTSAAINLSAGEKLSTDNSEGFFRMKGHTFFYEIGFGIDLYTPYFRVTPSIRALFAMKNEMVHDKAPNSLWTKNIDGMRTHGFMINLTFE